LYRLTKNLKFVPIKNAKNSTWSKNKKYKQNLNVNVNILKLNWRMSKKPT